MLLRIIYKQDLKATRIKNQFGHWIITAAQWRLATSIPSNRDAGAEASASTKPNSIQYQIFKNFTFYLLEDGVSNRFTIANKKINKSIIIIFFFFEGNFFFLFKWLVLSQNYFLCVFWQIIRRKPNFYDDDGIIHTYNVQFVQYATFRISVLFHHTGKPEVYPGYSVICMRENVWLKGNNLPITVRQYSWKTSVKSTNFRSSLNDINCAKVVIFVHKLSRFFTNPKTVW